MDTEAVKELKVKRRTAKARVTRISNALEKMLDAGRDMDEINESVSKLSLAYEDLEEKHEAYCETVVDDEQFETEDAWIEDCHDAFIDIKMRINDFTKRQASETPQHLPNNDDNSHAVPVGDSEPSTAATATRDTTSCKVQVERPKLPKFSGDVRDFTTFRSDFRHLIDSRYSKRDAITILRTCLEGKSLNLIKGIGNDYDEAWAYLDSIYGDPRFVADAIVNDIGRFRSLKEGEDTRFCDLVHLVRRSFNTLKEVNRTSDIDNSHMLALIERKMSPGDRRIWFRYVESEKADVTFQLLLGWMTCEMRTRLRASAPLREGRDRPSVSVSAVSEKENPKQPMNFKCWICKTSDHWVDKCKELTSKTQEERYKLMKDNNACYSCLKRAGRGHNMRTCKRRKRCNEKINDSDQCSSFHHPLLHRNVPMASENVAGISGKSGLLPVLRVRVRGPDRSTTANCLLDSGAQISLIRQAVADDLQLKGKSISVNITKVGGDVEEVQAKLYKMRLQSLDDSKTYGLSAVSISCITNDIAEVEITGVAKIFHLDEKCFHRESGPIDILVGIDHPMMHTGETRCKGLMIARHSPLGWVVFGAAADQQNYNVTVLNIALASPVDLRDFWTTESMGVCHDVDRGQPYELNRESSEFQSISDSCKKVGKQWLVPYPWRKDPKLLKDNKSQAMRMLHATERRLMNDPMHAEAYQKQIQDMVQMGFARKLSDEEVRCYQGPTYYISHHAVIRPDKKSTPVRIVFNSSALFEGESLNDYWKKGPDLLNSLFGVILRFREHPVALSGDISKMYHRVRIPVEDQHVHRFLWRDLEQGRRPDVYIMQVVTFGDKPSPAMAQMALRKTAEEGAKKYPDAARALLQNTYMDDICVSVTDAKDGTELSRQLDEVLEAGGFKVKEWRSNRPLNESETDKSSSNLLETVNDDKVLGMVWENGTDDFSYKVKLDKNLVDPQMTTKMTKRRILSQVARIFDPIGFAAAVVIRAKIGLQRLWEAGLDWDSELSEQSQTEWRKLFREIEELKAIKFERCLTPTNITGKPILCIFCDASMDAFGTCAYFRWEKNDGGFEVRFIAAKSRVAPLKQLTIPRLELQAAVLASRLYQTLKEEMTIEWNEVIFMTDSMIALSWIRSRARSLKVFVSTRVGEIQALTDPSEWRHIPGDMNVADDLTRGLKANQLKERWHRGPDFLRKPTSDWPEDAKMEDKMPEVENERRKDQSILVATTETEEDVIDCTRFSRWRKLVRVTSYVLKFIRKLKSKCKFERKQASLDTTDTLTPDDMQQGESYLIKSAQVSLKARVEKGELKTLSPYIDDTGIIRVGGRIDRAEMDFERRHPALLPYNHWISTLITRHEHEAGHSGVAVTTAKVRRKYWILEGHKLAKTVKFRCTTCRAFHHKVESQEMSELPKERLHPNSPPFFYTACDYFGPLQVKFGRTKTTKHYGVIFTCMNTRAVHLELAEDCSTMNLIQVLRRFFSIRGQPRRMISDNGTQFVGAERELREMVKSADKLTEYCGERSTEWTFVTPSAPHQNGCAESLVKSCKYALKKAIGQQVLTPFELYTCLLETANLVNQRPIGRLPTEPDDGRYLCPNDMLLGRASSDVAQGPFRETRNPRHRVELVQGIVNTFWTRWTRDVLPLLVPRKKWNVDRRNVQVDDVVMMADTNSVRGKWTIARVIEVYPGRDGKVRNVKLKTPTAEFKRPITKLAVIYPSEGYSD